MIESVIAVALGVLAFGRLYAWSVVRVHDRLHYRGADGLAEIARDVRVDNQSKTLVIFVHGFSSYSAQFPVLEDALRADQRFDYFAPTMLFHGRGLRDLLQLDIHALLDDLAKRMEREAAGYDRVVIAGNSFGAALVTDLALDGRLPASTHHVLLLAPAFSVTKLRSKRDRTFIELVSYITPVMDSFMFRIPRHDGIEPEVLPVLYRSSYFFAVTLRPLLRVFDHSSHVLARAAKLKYSVEVIAARNDPFYDFKETEQTAARLGAQVLALDRGRHLILAGEQARHVVDRLFAILDAPSDATRVDSAA